MGRLRKVEITNFRGIKHLIWCPSPGINCLIGPGDSGKSTVLDAIDLCLGARRTIQFNDADFHRLDVGTPIVVNLTIGELADSLKNLDTYGLFLRGFDPKTGQIEDEPERDLETVLTLEMTVESDLEPSWTLFSERARAQDALRNLSWGDRNSLAPTRIGVLADYNLGWRRGSVLNRLTDERADASAALAQAARDARNAFGADAEKQLGKTLKVVSQTAKELGIDLGDNVRALLDAHSVTFSGGTISLHDEDGVPARGLGTGSSRLLAAGLQRKAAAGSSLLLVDELEYGLEPHRIIRFLGSLGAKERVPPLQVIMTSHSPVALRELAGDQLFVLREDDGGHEAISVGTEDEAQSAIRAYPDAFLAASVLVCEGASEVGLIRGLDQAAVGKGKTSISANGVSLVDCGGGEPDRPFKRAAAFRRLGYRTAALRDDDQQPSPGMEKELDDLGARIFSWRKGRALEDEIFHSLPGEALAAMLDFAVALHGDSLVDDHIKSAALNKLDLKAAKAAIGGDKVTPELRAILSKAARTRRAGWFKSVSWMEEVARDIVAPNLKNADKGFQDLIVQLFSWMHDA